MRHPPTDVAAARHAVGNALAEYCGAVDDRDAGRVQTLLGQARLTFRDQEVAGSCVAAFYETAFAAAGPHLTTHSVSTLHVDTSGAAAPGAVAYRATYQRWEHTDAGPTCVALGTYSGQFSVDAASAGSSEWVWTSHHVTTHSASPTPSRSTT